MKSRKFFFLVVNATKVGLFFFVFFFYLLNQKQLFLVVKDFWVRAFTSQGIQGQSQEKYISVWKNREMSGKLCQFPKMSGKSEKHILLVNNGIKCNHFFFYSRITLPFFGLNFFNFLGSICYIRFFSIQSGRTKKTQRIR